MATAHWTWPRRAGGTRIEALPDPVRSTIAHEQIESERLIAVIVLIAVGGLALVTAARTGIGGAGPGDPLLWILSTYLVVALARLGLAGGARLPAWLPPASALADVAFLIALIGCTHAQGDDLGGSAWAGLLVVIALRGLGFEPRHVVLTGSAAMAGWAALVGWAAWSDPAAARDLPGTEFGRLVIIALVTAISTLAIIRGRRLLIRAAVEAAAARDLARFLPPEAARRITSAETPLRPGQGEVREAAVLQVDLKGFTCLAEHLKPDQAIGLLNDVYARLVPILHRHGGSIDKFLGDGLMATFGTARPSPTFAADAVRAAQDIVAAGHAWTLAHRDVLEPGARAACASSISLSVAVASGEVVIGALGDAERLDYTVIGHPVNLAAKLEKHTRIAGVAALTDTSTLDRARAQGFSAEGLQSLEGCSVAGLAAPIELVVLAT